MAREHIRGRNWTCEEDVALCLAWVSVSEDDVVGTNQNKKVLWDKIIAKFQENCNGGGTVGELKVEGLLCGNLVIFNIYRNLNIFRLKCS